MIEQITQWDFALLRAIRDLFHTPALDEPMLFLSWIGNGGAVWIVLALGLLCVKTRRLTGLKMGLGLLLVLLLSNGLLKNWVARPRPFELDASIRLLLEAPGEFSFPSGHTASSAAVAAVALHDGLPGRYVILAAAGLIAFSRLYLMVHFPSDVLAGALVGAALGLLVCLCLKCIEGDRKA